MALKKSGMMRETSLPMPLLNRGKVRDIYAVGKDKLLIVTTDRLSAFDVVLPSPIPDKGKVLNQISLFWFKKFSALSSNHLIESDIERMGFDRSLKKNFGPILRGRSVLVRRAKPLPVECVVRGYLAGSGWKDYQSSGAICGHRLPAGLRQCEALPKPIFTPTTKAQVGHDLAIDFRETARLIGARLAAKIRDLSLSLYGRGARFAKSRGVVIADTKFEFGLLGNRLILIDEVLTPDSSRFWPLSQYKIGRDQPSYDKQIVRNYLQTLPWDKTPPGPELPDKIIRKTSKAYRDVYRKLTGRTLS